MQFTTITCSEKGPREEQQDASGVVSLEERLLAVVCDGAGGHRGGSQASKVAVQVACDAFQQANGKFENPKAALLDICRAANAAVLKLGETPKLAPRTTITLLYLDGPMVHMTHVGDSRIYRLRAGKIAERTRDHTMVQILLEQGEIKEDQMGTHPDQGRLLRALGIEEEPKPGFIESQIEEGDGFLLCTDGFWERIKSGEIENLFSTAPTQKALDRLVVKALRRNGPKGDNVTAVIVFVGQPAPQAMEIERMSPRLGLLLALLAVLFVAWLLMSYRLPPFSEFLPRNP